ncbi:hypothetical protein JCM11491_006664 [Sporobolomyces phaffii]
MSRSHTNDHEFIAALLQKGVNELIRILGPWDFPGQRPYVLGLDKLEEFKGGVGTTDKPREFVIPGVHGRGARLLQLSTEWYSRSEDAQRVNHPAYTFGPMIGPGYTRRTIRHGKEDESPAMATFRQAGFTIRVEHKGCKLVLTQEDSFGWSKTLSGEAPTRVVYVGKYSMTTVADPHETHIRVTLGEGGRRERREPDDNLTEIRVPDRNLTVPLLEAGVNKLIKELDPRNVVYLLPNNMGYTLNPDDMKEYDGVGTEAKPREFVIPGVSGRATSLNRAPQEWCTRSQKAMKVKYSFTPFVQMIGPGYSQYMLGHSGLEEPQPMKDFAANRFTICARHDAGHGERELVLTQEDPHGWTKTNNHEPPTQVVYVGKYYKTNGDRRREIHIRVTLKEKERSEDHHRSEYHAEARLPGSFANVTPR